MNRGRPFGYLPFKVGDYLLQRAAIAVVIVVFIAGVPLYGVLHGNPAFFTTADGPAMAKQLFTNSITLFLPMGAFLGGTGIISSDRQQGHFRFLFSKPVNVVSYYVQTDLIHGVVFVALFGLITWVYGAATVHQPIRGAMAAAALTFALVGGLGFFFGALTRFDGVLVALTYLVSMTLQQVAVVPGSRPLPVWTVHLARILPPVYPLDQLREQLFAAQTVDSGRLWYVLAYGLALFLLGLLALRALPLTR